MTIDGGSDRLCPEDLINIKDDNNLLIPRLCQTFHPAIAHKRSIFSEVCFTVTNLKASRSKRLLME